mgnify:CR=1 FL=1
MAGQDPSKLRKGRKTGSVFGGLFKDPEFEMQERLKKAQARLRKALGRKKGKISEREMRRLMEDAGGKRKGK